MTDNFLVIQYGLESGSSAEIYHRISLPSAGQDGFGRQSRSFNAFFFGQSRQGSGRLRHCHPGKSFDLWPNPEISSPDPAVPVVEHDGLAAFYDFIGYDPKAGKAVRPPRMPDPAASPREP